MSEFLIWFNSYKSRKLWPKLPVFGTGHLTGHLTRVTTINYELVVLRNVSGTFSLLPHQKILQRSREILVLVVLGS